MEKTLIGSSPTRFVLSSVLLVVLTVERVGSLSPVVEPTITDEPGRLDSYYYLVTFPKIFIAGSTETVLVQLYDTDGSVDVWVALSIDGETVADDSIAVTDKGTLTLEVPRPEGCSTQGPRLQASLTVHLRKTNEDVWAVNEEKRLIVRCDNKDTFVQSDKAIYRPGQTVFFRVLTLDQKFIPDLRPVELIWIQAPNKVRVEQWEGQERVENGLVDLEFPMTSDPLLGTWEIHVLFQGVETVQPFVVEEYVLPRFEVTIQVSSTILVTDEYIPVAVCAVYTYGRPVRGSVEVALHATESRFIFNREPEPTENPGVPTVEETTDEEGCAYFELDLNLLRIRYRDTFNPYSQKLLVNATFVETVSGITQTAESEQIRVTTRPREMIWLSERTYKAGLPYFAKFELIFPDGTPSTYTPFEISCQSTNFTYEASLSTDSEGYGSFEVITPPGSLEQITCRPTFPGFPSTYSFDPKVYTLDPFAQSLFLQALYSPSSSYLQFEPVLRDLDAGRYIYLVLHFTCDSDDGDFPDIKFQLLSRGNVIEADIEVQGSPEHKSTDDGGYYEIHFKLRITSEMSPRVRIVAFYVRGYEVITAAAIFNVKQIFDHKVEIQFETDQVEPGEDTHLNIKSDPGSLCAVGVVDESVIILGGDNRLTTGKVFGSLDKYFLSSAGGYLDGPLSCIPDEDGLIEVPIEPIVPDDVIDGPAPVVRGKRQIADYFFPRRGNPSPEYQDGSKAFYDAGLIYVTNLEIETSPCREEFFYPVFFARADAAQAAPLEANVVLDEGGAGSTRVVRTYFPETWLWDLHPIGSSGRASVAVTAPDTITDWVGAGFCLHRDSGFGISDDVTLRAFQPFFLDLNLPYSVIRGEEIPISISVFNYLPQCLVVELTMKETRHFALLDREPQRVCICDEAARAIFHIQPLELGPIPIEVDAISVEDIDGKCGDREMSDKVGVRDALRRDLLVEAEGIEEERTYSTYFCPRDYPYGVFLDHTALLLPGNYVPDSASGKVTVLGDILGPTLTNLEGLLRVPYGCGEQNMISLVPNIYVLLYFTSTEQDNAAVQAKARQNIKIGYQRQLNFRLSDGSYSAFGASDGEGSAWLTAFVVRTLAQARRYVNIDETDLTFSVNWLKSLQDRETGCFRSSGRVIHKSMQGGVNDQYTLTAYILLAMSEAGLGTRDEVVSTAVGCLEAEIDSITDNYAISLVTYAMVKLRSQEVMRMFNKLEAAAISEEGTVHWESNRPDIPSYGSYYRYQQPAIQVEITAYALLSYLAYFERSDAVARSLPVITWLVSQQNPRGGFSSTQDTVVGLQSLAEYAALVYAGGLDIKFSIFASPPCEHYFIHVTDENKLVQQEQILPTIPVLIQLEATGVGCAIAKISWTYNVFPEARNDAPFTLNYTITPFENDVTKYHITICASYTGDDKHSNMALVENKPQSGFRPIDDSLRGLETKNLKRVDIEKRSVVVYFQELTDAGDCVSYDVEKYLNVRFTREGVLTVYDYYEKDLFTSVLYYIEEPPEGPAKTYQQDCPLCTDEVPENFKHLFCAAEFVYEADTKGNKKVYLTANYRDGTSRPADVPPFVQLELPEGCRCDLLGSSDGKTVLVIDDFADLRVTSKYSKIGYLPLGGRSAVLEWTPALRAEYKPEEC